MQRKMTTAENTTFEEHARGSGPLDHWTTHCTHLVCVNFMDRQLPKRNTFDKVSLDHSFHSPSLYWLYAYAHNRVACTLRRSVRLALCFICRSMCFSLSFALT
jgi:hypothetical protein